MSYKKDFDLWNEEKKKLEINNSKIFFPLNLT